MTGAWFHWHGGSWLEGAGLPAMGAQLCLGAGCAKVEAPGHPGHPPPLATQLLIDGQFHLFIFSDGNTYLDTKISVFSLHFGGLEITLV